MLRRRIALEPLEDRLLLTAATVNTIDDVVDIDPAGTMGDLPGPDNVVSLREALIASNNTPGADEIEFDTAGVFATPQTIALTLGELMISDAVILNGNGAGSLTVDAQGNSRVLNIDDGDTSNQMDVTVSGLTFTGGHTVDSEAHGGAIRTVENLTLTGVRVSGNSTEGVGARGGGIFSSGANLVLTGSTVSENSTSNFLAHGGGIYGESGTVTVNDSTISGNITSGDVAKGGGIYHRFGNGLLITNSTVSENITSGDDADGGGIFVRDANLTVTNSAFIGNSTEGEDASGGGIFIDRGDLAVTGSSFLGNAAPQPNAVGGAILAGSGTHRVTSSTISGNSADNGGGIWLHGTSYLAVNDSTISENTAAYWGGGFAMNGASRTAVFSNSTISGNLAIEGGGGLANHRGNLTIRNSTITKNDSPEDRGSGIASLSNSTEYASVEIGSSILSGNVNSDVDFMFFSDPDGPDFGMNTFQSSGYNLIGTGRGVSAFDNNDQTGVTDPLLGALADNGGPTKTHAVLPGSPALDAGDPNFADPPEFDQRGGPGFVRVFGGRIDIGSFESQPFVVDGDFNDDGLYNCLDIDALVAAIAAGTDGLAFDLSGDAVVDVADRDAWLAEAGEVNLGPGKAYLLGDANLDGVVDGMDFVEWNENKFATVAGWCGGDFTADGIADGFDFVVWNQNKFQGSGGLAEVGVPQLDLDLSGSTDEKVPIADNRLATSAPHSETQITTLSLNDQPRLVGAKNVDAIFARLPRDAQPTKAPRFADRLTDELLKNEEGDHGTVLSSARW